MPPKPSIFLCYAHADAKWKDRLLRHLETLEMIGLVDTWVDTKMAPGTDWLPQIKQAIDLAAVAILLVSPDFLRSPFIQREEVPRLLNQRASRGLQIVPVVVESCAWQRVDWLSRLQMRPRHSIPVPPSRAPRERSLTEITLEIAEMLDERLQKRARDSADEPVLTETAVLDEKESEALIMRRVVQGGWVKLGANGSISLMWLSSEGRVEERLVTAPDWPAPDSARSKVLKGSWFTKGRRLHISYDGDLETKIEFKLTDAYTTKVDYLSSDAWRSPQIMRGYQIKPTSAHALYLVHLDNIGAILS
jgi:hypothetical protein